MIVATAGHVDHGKTTLVKALTGIDTDRLAEEKRRGMSIDLGFAHADLGDGVPISFVDVPGTTASSATWPPASPRSTPRCSSSPPTTGRCRRPTSTSRSSNGSAFRAASSR
jgi:hypothetical protein